MSKPKKTFVRILKRDELTPRAILRAKRVKERDAKAWHGCSHVRERRSCWACRSRFDYQRMMVKNPHGFIET